MGEAGADVEKLMARMDLLQTAIDAANGWELERQLQRATDALRCPPGAPLSRLYKILYPPVNSKPVDNAA